MDKRVDGSEDRVAALEQRLGEVLQRLEVLEGENRALRSTQVAPAPVARPDATGTAGTKASNGDRAGVTRRRLLVGSVGAAAVGAVAVVGGATPAAANGQGQSLTLGDLTNSCTSPTGLQAAGGVDPVLLVTNNSPSSGNAAQFYVHEAGNVSAVFHAETAGLGPAGEFVASRATNAATILSAYTAGSGSAGAFNIGNAANTATALIVQTSGTGPAVTANAKGGGSAGFFVANGNNATMYASTSGTGNSGFFTSTSTSATEPSLVGRSVGSGAALRGIGTNTQLNLFPRVGGAPPTDTTPHGAGDLVEDQAGNLWVCTGGGTPGQWRKIAGPATAGAFHVLPTPVRVYDSRPGTQPAVGTKSPLVPNQSRTLDCTVNGSNVPADATAVMATLLLVNAANGNGNFTIFANGATTPLSNTMVWGTGSGRYSGTAVSAVSAAKVQVRSSATTDLVLDIVGYYR